MLFSALRRTLPNLFLIVGLVSLAACGGSDLADDELFNDQQAAVQRLDDDMKGLRTEIENLNRAVNNLLTEVENLKGEPLTGNVSGQKLEHRVAVIEEAIRLSNHELNELKDDLGTRTVKATPAPTRSVEKPVRTVEASSSSGSTRRVTIGRTPTPTPTPEVKVRAGFYHTVETGESLVDIANRYGVAAEDIRKANHIPPGRQPLAGQQLYIVR